MVDYQKKRKQCLSSLNHDITENAHNMTNSVATARKTAKKKKQQSPSSLYTVPKVHFCSKIH